MRRRRRSRRLAREHGTPLYVYSWARDRGELPPLRRRLRLRAAPRLLRGEGELEPRDPDGASRALGAGADVVSGGELRAALESGIPAERIVFSGVGKTDEEIAARRRARRSSPSTRSPSARSRRSTRSPRARAPSRASRCASTPTSTRGRTRTSRPDSSRTSSAWTSPRARRSSTRRAACTHVRMIGLQAHIGSQIVDARPLAETARELAALARELSAARASRSRPSTSAAASASADRGRPDARGLRRGGPPAAARPALRGS